jgi:hypothetical protein
MQFFITEYDNPAAMSAVVAFSRSDCFTLEFINTVHRVPKSHGRSAVQASAANSGAEYPSDLPNVSTNDPQPLEHAYFPFHLPTPLS